MALVRPRVHGNALGAGVYTDLRVLGYIGNGGVSRIADQRNFVEIDRQRDHSRLLRSILSIITGSTGTLPWGPMRCTAEVEIKSTTDIPSITSPNTA